MRITTSSIDDYDDDRLSQQRAVEVICYEFPAAGSRLDTFGRKNIMLFGPDVRSRGQVQRLDREKLIDLSVRPRTQSVDILVHYKGNTMQDGLSCQTW